MPRYVLLVDWTEQGVQAVEHTVDRLEQGTELGKSFGCEIEHIWWTQGAHDMVSVVYAPDEQAMVAYTLAVARRGGPRTTTFGGPGGGGACERISRPPPQRRR